MQSISKTFRPKFSNPLLCFPSTYSSPAGPWCIRLSRKPCLGKHSKQKCFTIPCSMLKSTYLSALLLLCSPNKGLVLPGKHHLLIFGLRAGENCAHFCCWKLAVPAVLKVLLRACCHLWAVRDLSSQYTAVPPVLHLP